MRCFCFLKNVIDQTSDETAYKRRYGFDFAGPSIPFGAHVEFLPKSQVDMARVHEFGSKMLQGIFVGYQQDSGGGWSKDLLVADWDQIENAEHVSEIQTKRFHYKEVDVMLKQGKFISPLVEGTLRQPGSNRYRNSSSRRQAKGDLLRGDDVDEERVDTDEEEGAEDEDRKEPAEAQPEETESADAPKDYWSFPGETIHIHHVQPRTTLFVPTEENYPIPVKYLDVMRRTDTDIEDRKDCFYSP